MGIKDLTDSVVGLANDVWGEDITYTPIAGSPVSIKGIFDNKYIDMSEVVSLRPTLRIQLSKLAAVPAKGDQVTISTVEYLILESHEDGFGGTTLILQKE